MANENTAQHVHLHLDGFSGHVEIKPDGTVVVDSSSKGEQTYTPPKPVGYDIAGQGPLPWSLAIEELLRRHVGYQPKSRSRELVATLLERGWTPHEPNTNTYVRCTYYSDKGGETTIYVRSEQIAIVGKAERELVKDLPGADIRANQTVFKHLGDKNYTAVLDIIDKLENFVDVM